MFSPSSLMGKFFGNTSTFSASVGWSKNAKMDRILNEIADSANLLINSGEPIKINWVSPAVKTSYTRDSFQISPDLMLDGRGNLLKEKNYYEGMDATTGRVLVGAQIRKNLDAVEYSNFRNSTDGVAQDAFQAMQENKAHQAISNDWPGFQPYLDMHKKKTHLSVSEVKDNAPTDLDDKQIDNFNLVANHNLLNPEKRVSVSPEIDEVVDSYVDRLENSHSFQDVQDAVNWLRERLKKETPPEGGEGEGSDSSGKDESQGDDQQEATGGDESKDDGQGKEQEKEDKKTPKGDNPVRKSVPKAYDKDLLGEKIDAKGDFHDYSEDQSPLEIDDVTTKVLNEKDLESINNRRGSFNPSISQNYYNKLVQDNKKKISEIEKVFLFENNTPSIYTHGLSCGELDENSLHKIKMGEWNRLYSQMDVMQQPSHLVGLLLDQSGSMQGGRIAEARKCVIMFYEALRKYKTLKTMIYGHTAQSGKFHGHAEKENHLEMIPYKVDGYPDMIHHLAQAQGLCENLDGLAIKHMANDMLKVRDVEGRYMLIITDGQPHGRGYSGEQALNHTKKMVNDARAKGIKVFAIGINNAFDDKTGMKMFGPNGFVVIDSVRESLPLMVRKLKSFITK